jgi:molybdopterin synthase catalytic subunit
MTKITLRIQAGVFDAAEEATLLTQGRKDLGAVVTFTGLCRDEGGTLAALEIEHYPGMAEDEISRVITEATSRWPLDGVTVIHRYGKILPGEPIVLVVTTGLHRKEAFEAASFLMDYLKTRAPFWKKQHNADGTSGEWVAAKADDDAAAQRWENESTS